MQTGKAPSRSDFRPPREILNVKLLIDRTTTDRRLLRNAGDARQQRPLIRNISADQHAFAQYEAGFIRSGPITLMVRVRGNLENASQL
jgi:hypothetical protein